MRKDDKKIADIAAMETAIDQSKRKNQASDQAAGIVEHLALGDAPTNDTKQTNKKNTSPQKSTNTSIDPNVAKKLSSLTQEPKKEERIFSAWNMLSSIEDFSANKTKITVTLFAESYSTMVKDMVSIMNKSMEINIGKTQKRRMFGSKGKVQAGDGQKCTILFNEKMQNSKDFLDRFRSQPKSIKPLVALFNEFNTEIAQTEPNVDKILQCLESIHEENTYSAAHLGKYLEETSLAEDFAEAIISKKHDANSLSKTAYLNSLFKKSINKKYENSTEDKVEVTHDAFKNIEKLKSALINEQKTAQTQQEPAQAESVESQSESTSSKKGRLAKGLASVGKKLSSAKKYAAEKASKLTSKAASTKAGKGLSFVGKKISQGASSAITAIDDFRIDNTRRSLKGIKSLQRQKIIECNKAEAKLIKLKKKYESSLQYKCDHLNIKNVAEKEPFTEKDFENACIDIQNTLDQTLKGLDDAIKNNLKAKKQKQLEKKEAKKKNNIEEEQRDDASDFSDDDYEHSDLDSGDEDEDEYDSDDEYEDANTPNKEDAILMPEQNSQPENLLSDDDKPHENICTRLMNNLLPDFGFTNKISNYFSSSNKQNLQKDLEQNINEEERNSPSQTPYQNKH
ncbi:MAG: hypothetical protein ACON5A_03195 [Candidatus Comchoanobacterales bacterium]